MLQVAAATQVSNILNIFETTKPVKGLLTKPVQTNYSVNFSQFNALLENHTYHNFSTTDYHNGHADLQWHLILKQARHTHSVLCVRRRNDPTSTREMLRFITQMTEYPRLIVLRQ